MPATPRRDDAVSGKLGVYPIAYLIPQLGIEGAESRVWRQVGCSVTDVLVKCLFGLLIYKIAREKSVTDDETFLAQEAEAAPLQVIGSQEGGQASPRPPSSFIPMFVRAKVSPPNTPIGRLRSYE